MNALTIRSHFVDTCDWVNPETTVDQVIAGDPHKPVTSALVTWISSFAACREAARRGVDLLITHEPTFWTHRNESDAFADDALAREKNRFIEESGLTILRVHDSWDRFPEIGIPFAWAKFLGFDDPPAILDDTPYHHGYDLPPQPAGRFARHVASRTAAIGEPQVQFSGDPEQTVHRVGLGTGCASAPSVYESMGCDLFVVVDDGTTYWADIQRSMDAGFPVIRVHHGTAEEPGMVTLIAYLRKTFPGISFDHLPHVPCFKTLGA